MAIRVPNKFPTIDLGYKLAIIGEAPGDDEERTREPFTGKTGDLLQAIMSKFQLTKSGCFVGNISQYKAPKEKDAWFRQDSPEIVGGLQQLKIDIPRHDPNCILLLGQKALNAAGITEKIGNYRGSIFRCEEENSPFYGYKCVASLHPAYIFRVYDDLPLLAFDVRRAGEEAKSSTLVLPKRDFEVELNAWQTCAKLDAITDNDIVSLDIEGNIETGITCVGVALSETDAFICILLDRTELEKAAVLKSLARVCSSTRIRKILQNSVYDNFCLTYAWKMPIRNVVHDTMVSAWEINPELEKNLGVQASIWTRQPFYKNERTISNKLVHYKYCCTDAAVTYEIAMKHRLAMSPDQLRHFEFNMQLLPMVNYMQLRGIKYDREGARVSCNEIMDKQSVFQKSINEFCASKFGFKELNINSPQQCIKFLYDQLRLPPVYNRDPKTGQKKKTADADAMLSLIRHDESGMIMNMLRWRALEGQRRQLTIDTDADGRVRCGYNLVGTDTGRMSCYTSLTGSGANLTTIMEKNRVHYQADEGYEFFQCDLSGADGWTVALHSNRLGDATMLNDYNAGIKPAKVIAAMYLKGWSIAALSQAEMKAMLASIEIPEDLYFICKVIQHGSNYMMKEDTMSSNILDKSWKKLGEPLWFTPKESLNLQNMYLKGRYRGIEMWWNDMREKLLRDGTLPCASGHTRRFNGRRKDPSTIRTMLSHEPQANTTYATNLAMWKLWHDPENIRPNGTRIIEPLHQVHDAACGQYPIEVRDWAKRKLSEYFNNTLIIADQKIVIPFGFGTGPNWYKAKG